MMMVWGGMTTQSVVMTGGLSSPPKATIAGFRHAGIPGTNLSLVHDTASPSHLHDRRSAYQLGQDTMTDNSVSGFEESDSICCDCHCHRECTLPKVSAMSGYFDHSHHVKAMAASIKSPPSSPPL
ncbi:hypothetical protein ElyMa_003910900 [Elysia marginata]|uniref:Uncharacterized protein n=1 Tax=Elysia marginata TaxID=1093978 RepID=A0AAV4FQY4_9GAST|nr:hypothetical protein ElyMa_003910900 [Elysia marginata]